MWTFMIAIFVSLGTNLVSLGIDEKCWMNKHVFCDHLSPQEKLVSVGMVPNVQELQYLCPDVLKYYECVSDHSKVCSSPDDPTTETINGMLSTSQDICNTHTELHKEYAKHSACLKKFYGTQPGEECQIKGEAVYQSYLLYKTEYGDYFDDADRTRHRYCMEKSYKTACIASKIAEVCGSDARELFLELIKRSKYLLPICSRQVVEEIKEEFIDYLDEEEMQRMISKEVFQF